jgi:hypothetical protein
VRLASFNPRRRFLNLHFQLWNISEKRVRSSYGSISNAAIFEVSPNGRFLACASYQGITLWRLRDGSKKILSESSPYAYSFIRFSPNGLYIVVVDSQNTLKIWNIRTGRLEGKWTKDQDALSVKGLRGRYHLSQHFWTINSFGANATAEEDQEEKILLYTGHMVGCHTIEPDTTTFIYFQHSNSIAVSADGRWVLSSSIKGDPHIRDARDGLHQCSLLGHSDGIASVEFSPVGNYLAVGKGDHVSLWSYKPRAN